MKREKKSSRGIELLVVGGLIGAAVWLTWALGEDECSNDPNAPADQRCTSGGSGHGHFSSGSGSGGGDQAARSERGGFGQFARRFNLFS